MHMYRTARLIEFDGLGCGLAWRICVLICFNLYPSRPMRCSVYSFSVLCLEVGSFTILDVIYAANMTKRSLLDPPAINHVANLSSHFVRRIRRVVVWVKHNPIARYSCKTMIF